MSYSHNELIGTATDVSRGTLFLFIGGTISTIIAALCSIIVARLLGPELYGAYSLCIVVPSFLLLFTDFGVNPALIKFSAKLKAEGRLGQLAYMIKHSLLFKLAISFTILCIGLIFSDILATFITNRPELSFLVRISIFLVLFNSLFSAINSILIGFNDMKRSSLLSIIQQLARSILSPLLIVIGFSILGAIVGYVISYILSAIIGIVIVYFIYYRKLSYDDNNNRFKDDLKIMINYGSPLYISSFINSIIGTYQGILLAWFTTNIIIGNFSIALNFTTLILLLINPISTALFPAFSKLNPDCEEIRYMVKYAIKYTAILLVPASVFVIIMSKDLVSAIYGNAYVLAPEFLSLYSISFLYAGLGSAVLGSFFNGIGETKVNLNATLIYSAIFIPMALFLIKSYSILGLIIGFLISTSSSFIYSLFVALKKFHVSIDFQNSLRIYLASAISAIPILMLTTYLQLSNIINLVISAIIYVFLYLTIIPLIGSLNTTDLENFKIIFGSMKYIKLLNLVLKYEDKLINFQVALKKAIFNFIN
jgi:O-antigen/teichoic acid export membrane protein